MQLSDVRTELLNNGNRSNQAIALDKYSDSVRDAITELALTDPSAALRKQAETVLKSWLQEMTTTELAARYHLQTALFHPDQDSRLAALQQLDRKQLIKAAQYCQNETLRNRALAAIADIPTLNQLLRRVRNSNKSVAQQIKKRLQELKNLQNIEHKSIATLQELCDRFELLASTTEQHWEQEASLRLLHLERQFIAIKEQLADNVGDAALNRSIAAARSNCERLDSNFKQALQQPRLCCESLEECLQRLQSERDWQPEAEHSAVASLLRQNHQQWQWAQQLINIDRETARRWQKSSRDLERFSESVRTLISLNREIADRTGGEITEDDPRILTSQLHSVKKLLRQLNWPEDFYPPAELKLLKDKHDQLSQTIDDIAKSKNRLKKKADQLIYVLSTKLQQQRLYAALAVDQQIQTLLRTLPAAEQKRLSHRLNTLHKQLQSLQDWKNHVCKPQLIELCEEMEHLAGKKQHPREQLEDLRTLRNAWLQLGYSSAREKLQPRFESAATKAYAPCARFFSQIEQHLEGNLVIVEQARLALESCLEELDTDYPNWPEIKEAVATADKVRQRSLRLPRGHGKEAKIKFEKCCEQLMTALEPASELQEQRKEKLIVQAAELTRRKQTPNVLDQAKGLQKAWKQLGIGRREAELFEKFNAEISSLFDQNRKLYQQQSQQNRQRLSGINESIAAIDALSRLDDRQLAGSSKQFAELSATVASELKQLPEKQSDRQRRKFQSASKKYQQRIDGLESRQQSAIKTTLRELADLCHTAANKKTPEATIAVCDQVLEQLASKPLPAAVSNRIKQRCEQTRCGEFSGDPQQRQLLCIRAEILAQLPSPAADGELRMKLQFESLKKNIGGGTIDRQNLFATLRKLTEEWYCGPAAAVDTENQLAPRMQAALLAIEKKASKNSTGKAAKRH